MNKMASVGQGKCQPDQHPGWRWSMMQNGRVAKYYDNMATAWGIRQRPQVSDALFRRICMNRRWLKGLKKKM